MYVATFGALRSSVAPRLRIDFLGKAPHQGQKAQKGYKFRRLTHLPCLSTAANALVRLQLGGYDPAAWREWAHVFLDDSKSSFRPRTFFRFSVWYGF